MYILFMTLENTCVHTFITVDTICTCCSRENAYRLFMTPGECKSCSSHWTIYVRVVDDTGHHVYMFMTLENTCMHTLSMTLENIGICRYGHRETNGTEINTQKSSTARRQLDDNSKRGTETSHHIRDLPLYSTTPQNTHGKSRLALRTSLSVLPRYHSRYFIQALHPCK